jgi:hypothetical protein
MSSAIADLWSFMHPSKRDADIRPKAEAFVDRLRTKNEFAAGFAAAFLSSFGFGSKPLVSLAFELLEREIDSGRDALRSVVSHTLLANLLSRSWEPGSDAERHAAMARPHRLKAAHLLVDQLSEGPARAPYSIYGASLTWNLEDEWEIKFLETDIVPTSYSIGDRFGLPLPGAFQHLVAAGDYAQALHVADAVAEGVRHPRILGWREICRAQQDDPHTAHHLRLAAQHFLTCPWPNNDHPWMTFESATLAPYCTARALVSEDIPSSSNGWQRLLTAVGETIPLDRAIRQYPPSHRFALVVHGLAAFLAGDRGALDELISSYQHELDHWGPHESDAAVPVALTAIRDSILEVIANPIALARGALKTSIAAIESLPARCTPAFVSKMGDTFAEVALEMAQGTTHREVLHLLKAITDERDLHRIVVELARAGASPHTKLVHGPVEYGKDVVALEEHRGKLVLRYYAIKAGDITMRNWPSLKESLEQAATVPSQDAVIAQHGPLPISVVALFNGHVNPHADPVVNAWKAEQLGRGRDIEFVGLDALTQRVKSKGLVDFLRNLRPGSGKSRRV